MSVRQSIDDAINAIGLLVPTSGKSPNVRRALEVARDTGLKSVALLGRDGGSCQDLASLTLIVPHEVTARIQEAHKVIIHIVCELIEPALKKK